MPSFYFISKNLLSGKTLLRIVLNFRLYNEKLSGKSLDLGSSGTSQYSDFIPRSKNSEIVYLDKKRGEMTDFEIDQLPYNDNSFDTILFLNVLEHIYNHKHIMSEIRRIKQNDGLLIGFVPFLKWYHQDPHDFFRYTHEAIEKILKETGYNEYNVESLYIGPYSTAFDMILPTVPKVLRPVLYAPCYVLDGVFRKVRPRAASRYALGYYFVAR